MSTQEWLVLLTVGFLLKESTAAVQIRIPNSHITVTSNGTSWKDSKKSKDWTADKVKDGIENNQGSADDCGCCAALQRPAWVQLTLDKTYIVEEIVVLGRTDIVTTQFDNIKLSLGRQNKSHQDGALNIQNRSARAILAPPSELDVVRVSGGTGQDIDTYMTICEIIIYRQAECLPGKYSVNCSKECHCLSGPCESVTGNCVTATCKDGWRGLACNETCDQGLFGLNCSSECHCLHGANCNHVVGNCSNEQCEPGWTNSNCSVACKHGFYGPSCSMECHCDKCNPVNGSCVMSLQCHAGYRMENGFCKPHEQIGGSTTFNAIGVVSGCIVAVVIIIGITFLTVYYRRQQLHAAKGHSKLSLPDQIEARFNNGFDHINRTNDGKNVLVQYKAEVASKNVCRLFSGKENLVPCDDNDYYSFRTPLGVGIKIHELWDYIHEKCQSSTFFEEEFKKFRCGLIHKHDVASSEENRGKTRYKQMYAYDHNRVPLTKEIDGDSEYINASYIHGFEKAKKFIASQGTTEKNLVDFWSMIWQQRVDKIVMLTNLIEMGTMKCLQYWPEELNSVCKYGRIDVKYIDVEEMFDYNIRTFTIKKGHDARLVKQFHFKSWPDKGVPDTAWCLVDFWRAVNTQEEHQSPILVHCSAGVGRTGTFIALDNLISQAQIESCVRPFQIVEALREQRVSMVQTKEQYAYLHEALAEALLVGTHHVMKRQFESVHRFMNAKDSISTLTRLEKQLELLKQSVESRGRHLQLGARPEAEYGNSGPHVTEIDVYRPQQQRKSEPPDEINIHTFNGLTGTIVLRKPNEQQLPMFWSRLKKLGSKTLIDLASGDIELKHLLINRKDGTHALKGLSAIKEEHKNGFVEITYSMTNETFRDKTIKHFVLTSWKEVDIPTDKKPLLEMIGAVYTWQSELTEDTPILILDSCGYRKCGVVAVLLNEIYRILEQNGRINIVQSVKTMVHENSLLIRSKMQYKFCYDVILDFVQQQGVYQNY
ncbi:receptor-type tyrosine-protein phosphatase epsilon-like [Dreissena polymorpha]|uniref:receptor-type tyrosine-protein phosphatase epsilon-like n=1 Tax=Dreissena polymorpha TaxID=45954 RepID=UPI0022652487|nr:receptor-type tyrosine-protein phosphatase epsilon-like [Dreissena polymorpha]